LRGDDEQLYEIAAHELEANAPRKGLYAQAYAEAMGDEARAKALYLKLRVAQPRAKQVGRQQPSRRAALDSPAACVKALREMGCAVGADATRSWTIVAPDGTPTRVFSFDGLQKHTLALRVRTIGPRNPDSGETELAEAASDTRPPADTR
jgi:hypothetical protein